ncbi:MAG: ATP-binding cassette domain-containing protein [Candidatus Thorarchaeota archaeon]
MALAEKQRYLKNIFDNKRKTVLTVKNLSVITPKGRHILNNMNLEVFEGEIIGIIGRSGTGKSTFQKALLDLLDRSLKVKGEIRVLGKDPFSEMKQIAPDIGYVPQSLDEQYLEHSPLDNCVFFGEQYGLSHKQIIERSNELFDKLDIPKDRRRAPLKKLSGGQMRRVNFAISMIHHPSVLILDEITSGLDPVLRHQTWEYIDKINRQYNSTFLVVTQSYDESDYCDRIAVFVEDVGFLEFGTARELLLKLPNSGFVVDVVLESFDDRALYFLHQVEGVRHVLMRGEQLRIFADTDTKTTVINVVKKLTTGGFKIHKLEPKNEASMVDYFHIVSERVKETAPNK